MILMILINRLLTCFLEMRNQNLYPTEILNTLILSFAPSHKLMQKVGIPIMLLKNLSPTKRLCNGARLIIKNLQKHHLSQRIAPSDANLHSNNNNREVYTKNIVYKEIF